MCIIDNITKIANNKGISQAFICEKLGKQRNYLFNLKSHNKKPSDEQMGIIANVLNVTIEELTGSSGDPSKDNKKSPSQMDELLSDPDVIDLLKEYRALSDEDRKDAIALLRAWKAVKGKS